MQTDHVVAVIHCDPGYNYALNFHEIAPPRWSEDSSLLLWKVNGKWFPDALVLVKLQNGNEKWQLDLLKTAQQAILERTGKAAPQKYKAAKDANDGNGAAYPDGFTVDVTTDGENSKTVSLPLSVHVDLTANPRQIENFPANLDSYLDAIVTGDGRFVVRNFQLAARPR